MASSKTEYLGLVVFPDITGVYQREIRIALVSGTDGTDSNMHIIDAAIKGLAEALNKLAKVATTGSYEDLSDTPDIPNAVPIATQEEAGKVKPDGVTITIDESGTIKATCEIATVEQAGIVKPDGITITVDKNGVIKATCEIATIEKAGIVKPDGDTITVDEDGTIRAANDGYSKEEVDTMLQELSDMLLTNSDLEMVYAATNTLMGEQTEFTGLGASLLKVNALADELLA